MSEKVKNALIKIIESGLQLSVDGFEFLKTIDGEKIEGLVNQLIDTTKQESPGTQVLDREALENFVKKSEKLDLRGRVTGKIVYKQKRKSSRKPGLTANLRVNSSGKCQSDLC